MRHAIPLIALFVLALVSSLVLTGRAGAGILSNDLCTGATIIPAVPFSAEIDTSSATLSASDPVLCDGVGQGGHSVWYTFTPAQSGMLRIETLASTYDTVVGVFSGTCASPVPVTCNDDFANARTSEAIFQADSGTPLLIEIAGFVGTTRPPDNGLLHFSLDFLPAKAVAKSIGKCQQTIEKSAAAIVIKGLGAADKCVNGLLACVETKASDPTCIAKQCTKCDAAFAKFTALGQTVSDKTTKACDPFAFAEISKTSGIGYELVNQQCIDNFGGPLATVGDVVRCVGNEHGCQLGNLFATEEPRAHELVALCPNLPHNTATDCFPDHGSGGGAVGDTATAKAILKCESAVKKAAAKFVGTKVKSLQKCTDKIVACGLNKPTDETCLIGAGGSPGGAAAGCDKQFAAIAAAAAKLTLAIDKKCAGISPFSLLASASGANVTALAAECAALGVPDLATLGSYETCLFRQHQCLVNDLLRFEVPRADGLLQLVTPIPALDDGFCPSPLRTSS